MWSFSSITDSHEKKKQHDEEEEKIHKKNKTHFILFGWILCTRKVCFRKKIDKDLAIEKEKTTTTELPKDSTKEWRKRQNKQSKYGSLIHTHGIFRECAR